MATETSDLAALNKFIFPERMCSC